MKYTNPTMKVTYFYDVVRTAEGNIDPTATLLPVSAPNAASKSLEDTFNTAAEGAATVLRFKWQ